MITNTLSQCHFSSCIDRAYSLKLMVDLLMGYQMGVSCPDSSELHLLESPIDLLVEIVEELPHLVLRGGGQLEFHVVEPGNDVGLSAQGLLDVAHRDLLLSLGGLLDDALAVLVELDDGLHHADGLVEGAVVVMLGEGVLLEELVLDDLGGLRR